MRYMGFLFFFSFSVCIAQIPEGYYDDAQDKTKEELKAALNDIIKGREVFSNVGAVASSSTLTRFITAKDDNEKKTLAWGAVTDTQGVLRLSLRDFRPHVALLHQVQLGELAQRITQDYIDAYAQGMNSYIRELQRITQASQSL